MIKHSVLIRLKDKNDINQVIENFNHLKNEIIEIQKYQVFNNVYLKRESNATVKIDFDFINIQDLETYLNHPFHIKTVNETKKYFDQVTTFDYEL